MKPRALLLLALALLVGAAVAVLPAVAAAPSEAKLEVNENCVENDWPCWAVPGSGSKPSPASKVTIAAGGEVVFTDNSSTKANVAWTGSAPACTSGVPVSPTSPQTPWEGRCKFEQPGTYKFESTTLFDGGPGEDYTQYEIVVEGAGTGTTTTTASTPTTTTGSTTTTNPATLTTTTTASGPNQGYGSPGSGSGSGHGTGNGHGSSPERGLSALQLAAARRGSTVHVSVRVSQVGAGGRLEIELLAPAASPVKAGHPAQVRVGRLVRSSLRAGSVSLSVPLSANGKSLLHRHGRLALTVKLTLTPPHGTAVSVTRAVVLHA